MRGSYIFRMETMAFMSEHLFCEGRISLEKITYTNSKMAITKLLVNKSTFTFFINREMGVNEHDVKFHDILECYWTFDHERSFSVPGEGFSRNASYALNLISTFSFE